MVRMGRKRDNMPIFGRSMVNLLSLASLRMHKTEIASLSFLDLKGEKTLFGIINTTLCLFFFFFEIIPSLFSGILSLPG